MRVVYPYKLARVLKNSRQGGHEDRSLSDNS